MFINDGTFYPEAVALSMTSALHTLLCELYLSVQHENNVF